MLRGCDKKLAFPHLLVTILDTLTRNHGNPQCSQTIESGQNVDFDHGITQPRRRKRRQNLHPKVGDSSREYASHSRTPVLTVLPVRAQKTSHTVSDAMRSRTQERKASVNLSCYVCRSLVQILEKLDRANGPECSAALQRKQEETKRLN